MSYIKTNLVPGEEVNIYIQQSKWLLVFPTIVTFFWFTLVMNQMSQNMWLVFLAIWVFLILHWYSFEFAITNKRVISKKGIISIQTNEININKIESVSMKKSIFNPFWDVVIQWTGGKDVVFQKIDSPQSIRDTLFKELEERAP